MKTRHEQKGMTAIAMVLLLVILGFFAMVVIKLFPLYLEQFKVTAALNSLADDPSAKEASEDEIKTKIIKKLAIDDVESITEDDIVVSGKGGERSVTIEYESRVPIIANIDAVVKYEGKTVKLR